LQQYWKTPPLPLFATVSKAPEPKYNVQSDIEKKISEIYPDDLSPKKALQILYDLKQLSQKTHKT
jgi:DNA mismatch repair protein MutS